MYVFFCIYYSECCRQFYPGSAAQSRMFCTPQRFCPGFVALFGTFFCCRVSFGIIKFPAENSVGNITLKMEDILYDYFLMNNKAFTMCLSPSLSNFLLSDGWFTMPLPFSPSA